MPRFLMLALLLFVGCASSTSSRVYQVNMGSHVAMRIDMESLSAVMAMKMRYTGGEYDFANGVKVEFRREGDELIPVDEDHGDDHHDDEHGEEHAGEHDEEGGADIHVHDAYFEASGNLHIVEETDGELRIRFGEAEFVGQRL